MKISRVPKLLSFFPKFLSSFSFPNHNKKLLLLFLKYVYEIISSCVLLKFLALSSLIIVAIFLSSTKLSKNDSEDSQYHSLPPLSISELYPLSHKIDEEILDETYSFTNNVDEIYSIVAKDDQEFTPRVVCLELIEGATGKHDDYKGLVQVKLIEGDIRSKKEIVEFHGYAGYEEDNDDEGDKYDIDSIGYDSKEDDDLRIRIEDFIAKNIKKWKEEMIVDNIQYLEY